MDAGAALVKVRHVAPASCFWCREYVGFRFRVSGRYRGQKTDDRRQKADCFLLSDFCHLLSDT
jgi:hypothetical protein